MRTSGAQPAEVVLVATAAGDVGGIDVSRQMLERDRPLVFVAVIGAEGDKSFAGPRIDADEHGQGDQPVAPDRIVLQCHVVVAPPRGCEIEFGGADDWAHRTLSSRDGRR